MDTTLLVMIASDHNGVEHKAEIKAALQARGITCVDLGPYNSSVHVDYVDYARQLANIVSHGDAGRGILICGTGVGMCIAANKQERVRAALVHNWDTVRRSREHNDSNVLCLGSWVNSGADNVALAMAWLGEPFGELRHVRRIEKLENHAQGRIVLANGVFDILHTGHIELLRFAKSLGERLVVGINSDASTRQLKGPNRPVNREEDRKAVLQSIRYVDEVIIFEGTDTRALVAELRPHIVVKGGEWTADEVRRRDQIPDEIIVKVCPLVTGYSSTGVISHIRTQHA